MLQHSAMLRAMHVIPLTRMQGSAGRHGLIAWHTSLVALAGKDCVCIDGSDAEGSRHLPDGTRLVTAASGSLQARLPG